MRIKHLSLFIIILALISTIAAYSQQNNKPKKVKNITCTINTDNVSGSGADVFAIKESKVQGTVYKSIYDTYDYKFKVTLIKNKEPKVSFSGRPDVRVFHFDLDNPENAFLDVIYRTGFNKEAYDKLNQLLDSPIGTEMEIEFSANLSEDATDIFAANTVYLYRVEIGERIDFAAFDSDFKKFINAYLQRDINALADMIQFPMYNEFSGVYDENFLSDDSSTLPNTKEGFLKGGYAAIGINDETGFDYTIFSDKEYNFFPKVEAKSLGEDIVLKRTKKDDVTVMYTIRLEKSEHYDISLGYLLAPYELQMDGVACSFYFKKVGNSYKLSSMNFGL